LLFINDISQLINTQDIIPRIFNFKIHIIVGIALIMTIASVFPIGATIASGSSCVWNS